MIKGRINQLKKAGVEFVSRAKLEELIEGARSDYQLETALSKFSKNGLAGFLLTSDIWGNQSEYWYLNPSATDEDVKEALQNMREAWII